jgi:hypothetical protein
MILSLLVAIRLSIFPLTAILLVANDFQSPIGHPIEYIPPNYHPIGRK